LCSDDLILSGWLRLHYLQLGLPSSPLAHTYRFFCSHYLQLSGQENGGFLNHCRYVHQTAENLGFLGNQPGKKFKVSFDDRHTSFLTGEHKCHPSQAVGYPILGCNSCEQTTG
jgi:hypothetical protein